MIIPILKSSDKSLHYITNKLAYKNLFIFDKQFNCYTEFMIIAIDETSITAKRKPTTYLSKEVTFTYEDLIAGHAWISSSAITDEKMIEIYAIYYMNKSIEMINQLPTYENITTKGLHTFIDASNLKLHINDN